ncbi:hypothetical protein C8R46DRAFT_1230104 [Mycena filopes]|nr:hypothetical protein C8R46DRAFT_1230104 [Mycena filopes]
MQDAPAPVFLPALSGDLYISVSYVWYSAIRPNIVDSSQSHPMTAIEQQTKPPVVEPLDGATDTNATSQLTALVNRLLKERYSARYFLTTPIDNIRLLTITAEAVMRSFIFDWEAVIPMARFIFKVVRSWKWFGRRLPTMVCELAPDTDDGDDGIWNFETGTEDGSGDDEMDATMDIDF